MEYACLKFKLKRCDFLSVTKYGLGIQEQANLPVLISISEGNATTINTNGVELTCAKYINHAGTVCAAYQRLECNESSIRRSRAYAGCRL